MRDFSNQPVKSEVSEPSAPSRPNRGPTQVCHRDALVSRLRKRWAADGGPTERENTTMTAQESPSRSPSSWMRGYSTRDQLVRAAAGCRRQGCQDDPDLYRGGAVPAARLPGRASWEQADRQDIQQWMTWLLDVQQRRRRNQYRALQQFFKWLAADQVPDPIARLQRRTSPQSSSGFTGEELTRRTRPVRAAASRSAAIPRSSRCSRRPASGWPSSACGRPR